MRGCLLWTWYALFGQETKRSHFAGSPISRHKSKLFPTDRSLLKSGCTRRGGWGRLSLSHLLGLGGKGLPSVFGAHWKMLSRGGKTPMFPPSRLFPSFCGGSKVSVLWGDVMGGPTGLATQLRFPMSFVGPGWRSLQMRQGEKGSDKWNPPVARKGEEDEER